MDGLSLKLDIEDAIVQAALAQLATVEGDKTPLMDAIGQKLEESTRERFNLGQAPDGTPWEVTKWTSPQVQVASGQLRDSTAHLAGPDYVEVGSNLPYARQRHFGGTIRAKVAPRLAWTHNGSRYTADSVWQPPRHIFGVSAWDREDIGDAVAAFVAERTGGAVQTPAAGAGGSAP